MMLKYFSVLSLIISVLWNTCSAQNACTSIINGTTEMIFTCLSNITITELPLYDYTTNELEQITSIVVNGPNENTRGPFTSIPSNICFLPNLQRIDFSNNRIIEVDPVNALSQCLSNVITLDVSYNNISVFPSVMIYNMPTLVNLYFQHNSLVDVPGNAFSDVTKLQRIDFSYNYLTTFEFWACLVTTSADFSNNRISTITNSLFLNISQYFSPQSRVLLTNNSLTINLTDAIFPMYGACLEANTWLNDSLDADGLAYPALTLSLTYIDFGTSRINCSCDQEYLIYIFDAVHRADDDKSIFPLYHAMCTNGTLLMNSSCNSTADLRNSSVDFTKSYPRLCKIYPEETGNLTIAPNITAPIGNNVSTYPNYERELMDPGACIFSFINTSTVHIKCTNEVTNTSRISPDLLASSSFSNITRIIYDQPISSLPSYLCSIPSRQIDLSYQAFTTLTDATFPCLNYFTRVTLSHNNISSINMNNGNFTNLEYLDLSSNRLTTIPHSILRPTPSSLRLLDLRNNLITSIDVILLTLQNITVLLDGNPINSSSIINPGNITFPSTNNTSSTANISLPSNITHSIYTVTDQTVLTVGACNLDAILTYLNILRLIYNNIVLQCTCTSIHLKEIFHRNGSNILNILNCSNETSATNYTALTLSSCGSTALYFVSDLCYNDSLQWTTIITTSTTSTTSTSASTTTDIETNYIHNPNARELNTDHTGLIVGLVIGLTAFVVIVGIAITVAVIKAKRSAALRKPVGRAMAMSQAPQDALLESRLQTRNIRSIRLTPLSNRPSHLPPVFSHATDPVTFPKKMNY